MPTRYVRKSGSDSNGGTSPADAWLTIDKAANTVAAGDVVYIGGGWYGEGVTIDTSGSSGSAIQWRGDVLGLETGDAGLVVISTFDTPSGANVRNNAPLNLNHKTFNEFYDLVIMAGGASFSAVSSTITTTNYAAEGVLFERCLITCPHASNAAVRIDVHQGLTPTADGLTMRNCTLMSANDGIGIYHNRDGASMTNLKWRFENCQFWCDYGIASTASGTGTVNSPGGIWFTNCLFVVTTSGANLTRIMNTTDPIRYRNCFFPLGSSTSISSTSGASGAVTQGGCVGTPAVGSVTTEYTSDLGSVRPLGLLGGLADMSYWHYLGWSPFKPFEPMWQPDGSTLSNLSDRLAASATTTDWYGNPRPMGRSSAPDVGHVEANVHNVRSTSSPPTGEDAGRLLYGAGYLDSFHEVAAASTTFTCYVKRDANYSGGEPSLTAYDAEGASLASDALAGGTADDTWEQLSLTFTPAAAGVVRIRRLSLDTSLIGTCSFGQVVKAA